MFSLDIVLKAVNWFENQVVYNYYAYRSRSLYEIFHSNCHHSGGNSRKNFLCIYTDKSFWTRYAHKKVDGGILNPMHKCECSSCSKKKFRIFHSSTTHLRTNICLFSNKVTKTIVSDIKFNSHPLAICYDKPSTSKNQI